MSNLQLYTPVYCSKDGTLFAEATQVTFNRSTNSQEIKTILKGYAGESPGAIMVEADVENAVPVAGIEFDAGAVMNTLTPIELGFATADGKTAVFKGFVIKDSLKHGTGTATSYSFSFRGQFAEFQ